MDRLEFVRLVEVVAECELGSLAFNSNLEDFGWDSLAVISLIAELDRVGGFPVDVDSLAQATTIQNVFDAVMF